jgi:hypothetical protein
MRKQLAIRVSVALMSSFCFPFRSFFVENVLLKLVQNTMDLHVLPNLKIATIVSTSFDIWMSKGGINTFVLVIN